MGRLTSEERRRMFLAQQQARREMLARMSAPIASAEPARSAVLAEPGPQNRDDRRAVGRRLVRLSRSRVPRAGVDRRSADAAALAEVVMDLSRRSFLTWSRTAALTGTALDTEAAQSRADQCRGSTAIPSVGRHNEGREQRCVAHVRWL